METALPFTAWESFYVIVGSSAAALTGLQFVVIVLGAETKAIGNGGATRAYTTPTVVHFCAVLLVSAILSAPWPAIGGAAIALGGCGATGIVYVTVVIAKTRRQHVHRMRAEEDNEAKNEDGHGRPSMQQQRSPDCKGDGRVGREQPRSGDKFVWNDWTATGRPRAQARGEHQG